MLGRRYNYRLCFSGPHWMELRRYNPEYIELSKDMVRDRLLEAAERDHVTIDEPQVHIEYDERMGIVAIVAKAETL